LCFGEAVGSNLRTDAHRCQIEYQADRLIVVLKKSLSAFNACERSTDWQMSESKRIAVSHALSPHHPPDMSPPHVVTTPLVRIDAVSRLFRAGEASTRGLAGVSLEVHAGEYVAISGPSGCGKSTLLAILGLLDAPTSGEYHLGGRPVTSLAADERARVRGREIGFVFQSFNLIGDLSVYDNVELPLTYRKKPGAERRERVLDALARVGMENRADDYPGQLSGGQQQRIAVARAVAGQPRLLLADEPTGNLDSANGEAVMTLLSELHAEGTTIVMVTHDPRYGRHAERGVHLLDGRITGEEHFAAAPRRGQPEPRGGG
jgi:putative ABC transport system ATP-binding protein